MKEVNQYHMMSYLKKQKEIFMAIFSEENIIHKHFFLKNKNIMKGSYKQ